MIISSRRRGAWLALVVATSACQSAHTGPRAALAPDSLAIRRDIFYLASDALAGRLTGTPGNDSAAAYIARRYATLGLRPMSEGYLQRFVARPPSHAGPSPSLPTQNVFAVLPGRDPALRGEYIVIGAHFDHLGTSTDGALDPDVKGAVRRGADDNASGTAAVLELARLLAAAPTRRSIIFANFSGEEEGLLGSAYFVEHSPVAIDSIAAMLNFDMVGRLKNDKLIVYGILTAKELPSLLDSATANAGLRITAQGDGFGASDQSSFYAKDIPVLHFFTDLHDDYHRATDVPEHINAAGEARVVAVAERVAREIGDRGPRLTFVRAVAAAPASSTREGSDVYFGSIPDMAGGDAPGLRLTGVRAGSPADIAGLKAGDVIVEFGGKSVKDLFEYSNALYSHKPGDAVSVVVLRGTQRLTLQVKLGKRSG
ncbi:MAG TPA: M20/M25/M40 family metallo-hydrolase [Gemmatimonadaceae bacterium]|jgi:aminopeptidase YwaD|nr:M20/M25/M40 family metallo-hydrolase [Gemmatimonadaceae bacterium]